MLITRVSSVFFCALLVWGCGDGTGTGGEPVCGNRVAEEGEECDGEDFAGQDCESLNLGGGELACDTQCRFVVRDCELEADCGNELAEYPEECDATDLGGNTCEDLGFDSGNLSCTSECFFDTVDCVSSAECGDGVAEVPEECDGNDLGGESCDSLGLGGGSLDCDSDCHYDVGDCDVQPECGNGAIEYPEVCDSTDLGGTGCTDVGYYGGELSCDPDCNAFDTSLCEGHCGDGIINGAELCDGTDVAGEICEAHGYYPGELSCNATCDDFDTSTCGGTCGDGVQNGPENCDQTDFGADSCQARGFYTGNLVCGMNCLDIDDSGCAELCGDGVINGAEACDGDEVGGFTCANGAVPRCVPDCSEIVCNLTSVLIVEVGHGNPDWVELLNTSANPVNLLDWTLEWQGYDNNNQPDGGVLVIPDFTLQPGERVAIYDEYPGDGSPPEAFPPNSIDFHVNIWWGDSPGSVLLSDDVSAPIDFLRWGGPDFDPPAGMPWADGPEYLPGSNDDGLSLSRNPEDIDTDDMGDFCQTMATKETPNDPCPYVPPAGSVLITEIDTGDPPDQDRAELYNNSNTDVDLADYVLVTGNGWNDDFQLPSYILAPGDYVAIIDDCPGNCPQVDPTGIHVENISWQNGNDGFCVLAAEWDWSGVDFVRWGGNNDGPYAPDIWDDGAGQPPAMAAGQVIGRSSLVDTDSGDDWCVMTTDTFGAANSTCQ